MMKKRKHEKALAAFFAAEAAEATKDKEDALLRYHHPDDILMASDECGSDVSDVPLEALVTGIGGMAVSLGNLPGDLYVCTFTAVIAASNYVREPAWRKADQEGKLRFDKHLCHQHWRRDVQKFVNRMKGMWKWDFYAFHSALFEEDPGTEWNSDNLIDWTSGTSEEFQEKSVRTHAHILNDYRGNRDRGTQVRVLKAFEQFMTVEKGWKIYLHTVYDASNRFHLRYAREKQETYLMVSQYHCFRFRF